MYQELIKPLTFITLIMIIYRETVSHEIEGESFVTVISQAIFIVINQVRYLFL
jgi:hypothetical protein